MQRPTSPPLLPRALLEGRVGLSCGQFRAFQKGSGFRVQGFGFRVKGLGFRVQGSGFGVS